MEEDGKVNGKDDGDELAKYNLDDYDKESKSIGAFHSCLKHLLVFNRRILASGPFRDMKSLAYYKNNDEDPYITLKEVCLITSPRATKSNEPPKGR